MLFVHGNFIPRPARRWSVSFVPTDCDIRVQFSPLIASFAMQIRISFLASCGPEDLIPPWSLYRDYRHTMYTMTIAVFSTLIQYFLAGTPIGLIDIHDIWLALRRNASESGLSISYYGSTTLQWHCSLAD